MSPVSALDIIHSFSILALISLLTGLYARRFEAETLKDRLILGLIFGLATLAIMLTPIRITEGLLFDSRSVLISSVAFFYNPLTSLIAASFATGLRCALGGISTLPGVAIILISWLIGSLAFWLSRRSRFPHTSLNFVILGLVVSALTALTSFILSADSAWGKISDFTGVIILGSTVATGVVGIIFKEQRQRHQITQDLKQRLNFESGLVASAQILQQPRPDNETIPAALKIIINSLKIERASLFENFHSPESGFCMRQILQIDSPDYQHTREIANSVFQKLPWDPIFTDWRLRLETGEPVQSAVSDYPAAAREFLIGLGD